MWYRAKAGGRQSTKDATGKSIKSAGAQIRRYNEVSTTQLTITWFHQPQTFHKVIGMKLGVQKMFEHCINLAGALLHAASMHSL